MDELSAAGVLKETDTRYFCRLVIQNTLPLPKQSILHRIKVVIYVFPTYQDYGVVNLQRQMTYVLNIRCCLADFLLEIQHPYIMKRIYLFLTEISTEIEHENISQSFSLNMYSIVDI
jgi:hypothetical protein